MYRLVANNLLFAGSLILLALTTIESQYSGSQYTSNPCDHNRLQRCQQDITQNIQDLSGSSTGPGYSGLSSGYQGSGSSGDTYQRCSAIRQNLDCLLVHTPPCVYNKSTAYDTRTGTYENQRNNPGDFIRRGKQTIERYCEQGGGGWKTATCFTRQDVRECESRFGFTQNPPAVTPSACRTFQDFRDCVVRIVRGQCYSQDLQLMATYLIDKAQDLSWSCVVDGASYGNPSRMDYNPNDPYRSGSGSSYGGSGYGNSQYDRDRTTYDNRQPYDPNRGQYGNGQYDPNRNTYDRDRYGGTGSSSGQYGSGSQYGGSQLGSQYGGSGSQYGSSQYGSNQPIDRFGGGGYMPTADSCLERSGYFVRTCEDTLIQRQRDAREGRSSNDVQRRICCALFFYRDCISRVVVERCRDPSPVVVDILMGSRKRDLTVTCREYSRDQCSGSSLIKSSFISLVLSVLIPVFVFRAQQV